MEEKKIEEMDVVFLMDRFGYAKTVDVSVYERNKEAADTENRYILTCKNTDKICIFTNKGQMHLLKVLDLPYGKFRDKGIPIDNLSNYNISEENFIYIINLGAIIHSRLLFGTKTAIDVYKRQQLQPAPETGLCDQWRYAGSHESGDHIRICSSDDHGSVFLSVFLSLIHIF